MDPYGSDRKKYADNNELEELIVIESPPLVKKETAPPEALEDDDVVVSVPVITDPPVVEDSPIQLWSQRNNLSFSPHGLVRFASLWNASCYAIVNGEHANPRGRNLARKLFQDSADGIDSLLIRDEHGCIIGQQQEYPTQPERKRSHLEPSSEDSGVTADQHGLLPKEGPWDFAIVEYPLVTPRLGDARVSRRLEFDESGERIFNL